MADEKKTKIHKYFAAANGYSGFVSLFDKVFPSGELDRIYVLKGGPGTGKSSLMKKAAKALAERGCDIDEIYCSSDPHSLDGIMARSNGKAVAIIDGTAPHERDAKIPGAADEIINLGDNWDTRFLTSQKEEIVELSAEKSKAYSAAYSYLKIAGACADFIFDVYRKIFNKTEAKTKAEFIFNNDTFAMGKQQSYLTSSFGKYGHYKIDGLNFDYGKTVRVYGNDFSISLFLDFFLKLLKDKGCAFVNFPSPLDFSHSDGIYIPSADLLITTSLTGEINADDFICQNSDTERTRQAISLHRESLEEAKRWFSIASDFHFRLEDIYRGAMNFEKNDEILSTKLNEIENILEKAR